MAVRKSVALLDCIIAALSTFFTSKLFAVVSILVGIGLVKDSVVRVGLVGLLVIWRYNF